MAKNRNYKYNALDELNEKKRLEEKKKKKTEAKKKAILALKIAAIVLAALAVICIAVSIWANIPRDFCFEYRNRKVAESDAVYVEMKVEGYDAPVILLLDEKAAPVTVRNFVSLVNKGFYDGLDFHRIIKGFMIQGGDPQGTGMGGSGTNIKGEFRANGHDNPIKHTRGVISMARAYNPNSASSQFFIMHADAPHLDGQYAAFGKVVSGIEAVDEIANIPTDYSDRPKIAVRIKRAYLV